jgi:3-deoxy-manno-octulosonate cytidylyltransferase (CMP-KDO synthetase)
VKVWAVIPARLGSLRFPRKPLARILDKPMIEWVIQAVRGSTLVDHIILATDSEEIYAQGVSLGVHSIMTDSDLPSGTDRVYQALIRQGEIQLQNSPQSMLLTQAQSSSLTSTITMIQTTPQTQTPAPSISPSPEDMILNIQGDEPLLDPKALDSLILTMKQNPQYLMGTLMNPLESEEQLLNLNSVKVLKNRNYEALYFSRFPVPYSRERFSSQSLRESSVCYHHVGLYAYRYEFLKTFCETSPSPLEQLEGLEQLRALDMGIKILLQETTFKSQGVDVPEDIEKVEKILRKRGYQ